MTWSKSRTQVAFYLSCLYLLWELLKGGYCLWLQPTDPWCVSQPIVTDQATSPTPIVVDVGQSDYDYIPQPALDTLEVATVAAVIDGDTIRLIDQRKLRYIGIDTPETSHPEKGIECFGIEAHQFNEQLVVGQTVYLQKDKSETDRYGRLLRYVWLNGKLVNEILVIQGYARAKKYPPDVFWNHQLKQAETKAQTDGKGMWAACSNSAP